MTRLEETGLRFSGMSPDGVLPEIIELPGHPWFVGVQYHPELKSKPFAPHPLFAGFIAAAVRQARLGLGEPEERGFWRDAATATEPIDGRSGRYNPAEQSQLAGCRLVPTERLGVGPGGARSGREANRRRTPAAMPSGVFGS